MARAFPRRARPGRSPGAARAGVRRRAALAGQPADLRAGAADGTGAPASGRYSVTSRSPLTGTVFDGNSGGNLGNALRRLAGDYLIVAGALDAPGYVTRSARRRRRAGRRRRRVRHSRPADAGAPAAAARGRRGRRHRPGRRAWRALRQHRQQPRPPGRPRRPRRRHGGQAPQGDSGRRPRRLAPGRRRPGASRVHRLRGREAARPTRSPPPLPEFGTSVLVNVLDQAGALPTRNFREPVRAAASLRRDAASATRAEALPAVAASSAAPGAPPRAARAARAPSTKTPGRSAPTAALSDLTAIVQANYACNRAGMDTITMGVTIACAMELAEEGLLPGGPRFGDAAAVVRPGRRHRPRARASGDELAEGSPFRRALRPARSWPCRSRTWSCRPTTRAA